MTSSCASGDALINSSRGFSSAGFRLSVTSVAPPRRVTSKPRAERICRPSRSDGRETPSCTANLRSAGSRSPGFRAPSRISCSICRTTESQTRSRAIVFGYLVRPRIQTVALFAVKANRESVGLRGAATDRVSGTQVLTGVCEEAPKASDKKACISWGRCP